MPSTMLTPFQGLLHLNLTEVQLSIIIVPESVEVQGSEARFG